MDSIGENKNKKTTDNQPAYLSLISTYSGHISNIRNDSYTICYFKSDGEQDIITVSKKLLPDIAPELNDSIYLIFYKDDKGQIYWTYKIVEIRIPNDEDIKKAEEDLKIYLNLD